MHALRDAASQAWPPFVLVTGLLMVGAVAHAAGLFEAAGAFVGRLPGPPVAALAWCMALVAAVTATMNLDTAVVFLTPVLVLVARRRELDERAFLYAALFMANASSLFLPGANLTNLLVTGHGSGRAFFSAMIWPALAAALVTALGLWLLLGARRASPGDGGPADASPVSTAGQTPPLAAPLARRTAMAGVVVAGVLTIAASAPALPVLVTGFVLAAVAGAQRIITPAAVARAVGPAVLVALFALSVALGVLARSWDGPAELLAGAGRWETVGVAAVASITVNNLPAAVLLTAHPVEHTQALLIGLNLGPNLVVSGSLSSYLWFRAAKSVGAEPSVLRVTRLGLVLAPAAMLAATASLAL